MATASSPWPSSPQLTGTRADSLQHAVSNLSRRLVTQRKLLGGIYWFQSKKEDSETKVGNVMNLEGGLGGDFLKGGH